MPEEVAIRQAVASALRCDEERVGTVLGTNLLLVCIQPAYMPRRGSSDIQRVLSSISQVYSRAEVKLPMVRFL